MPIDVRRRISHKQANTWRYRDGVDRYSGVLRGDVRDPETDHVIEIQIINDAVNRAIKVPSMANACAEIDVVRVFNDTCNLNVTSRKINQAKKGPIRACMNNYRLVQERGLRALSLESAARRGTARWLVDEVRALVRNFARSLIDVRAGTFGKNSRDDAQFIRRVRGQVVRRRFRGQNEHDGRDRRQSLRRATPHENIVIFFILYLHSSY